MSLEQRLTFHLKFMKEYEFTSVFRLVNEMSPKIRFASAVDQLFDSNYEKPVERVLINLMWSRDAFTNKTEHV